MEQAIKERLVGALVLVALAVLLIPELLSGRKPAVDDADRDSGPRSHTIELQPPSAAASDPARPGPKPAEPPAETRLSLPAPPVANEAPEIEDASDGESQSAPVTAQAERDAPAAGGPPATTPATHADEVDLREPPAPGGLAVQVGAFGSETAARKLARELQARGYDAYLSPVERGGKTLQRVRVGPARDAAAATAIAERLKQQGYGSAVVVGT